MSKKLVLGSPSSVRLKDLSKSCPFIASSSDDKVINFRHPAYPPGDDLLFSLYASDHADGDSGLHHGLAHTACAIVAGNRHDGYLSESPCGGTRIEAAWDDVLLGRDYYFHVPGSGNVALTSQTTL